VLKFRDICFNNCVRNKLLLAKQHLEGISYKYRTFHFFFPELTLLYLSTLSYYQKRNASQLPMLLSSSIRLVVLDEATGDE